MGTELKGYFSYKDYSYKCIKTHATFLRNATKTH